MWALCSDGGAAVHAYGIARWSCEHALRAQRTFYGHPTDILRTSYGHPTDKEPDTTDKEPDKEPDILRTSYGHPTDKEPDITGHEATTPLLQPARRPAACAASPPSATSIADSPASVRGPAAPSDAGRAA